MMQHTDLKAGGTIFHGLVIVPGGGRGAIHDGAIYIKGAVIEDVGESSSVLKRHKNVHAVELPGFLVCPGFVNAHTHAAMSFFRDLGHDRSQPKQSGNSMIEDFFFPTSRLCSLSLFLTVLVVLPT